METKVGGGSSQDLRQLMARRPSNPRARRGGLGGEEEPCEEGGGRRPGKGPGDGKKQKQEEEPRDTLGATGQPKPASSTRKLGWLKPPTEAQDPRRRRRPRRNKNQVDVTQRTIKIARRRKQEGGDGVGGEVKNLGGGEEEWVWGEPGS